MVGVSSAVAARNTITTVGNAQVSTAQSKFGGASALFDDATQGYLSIPDSTALRTGTGAFTVEGWFRPQLAGDAEQGPGTRFFYFKGVNSATGIGIGVSTDGILWRGPSFDDLGYTVSLSSSAWNHLAFVFNGTTKTIYLNGTSVASAAHSLNITNTSILTIGGFFTDSRFNYDGYIDEIRVSKVARYTTTFTPSASAFTNDANTLLLIHADGTNGSTTFTDDNA
jgi:hypothetical protein